MKTYKAYLESSNGRNIIWTIRATSLKVAKELVYQRLPSWIYFDSTTAFKVMEEK